MYQWAPGRGGKGILQLCFSSRMNNTSRIHNAWSELWELSCLSLLTFIYLVGWRCIEPLLFCCTLQWLRETRGTPKVKDADVLFSLTRLHFLRFSNSCIANYCSMYIINWLWYVYCVSQQAAVQTDPPSSWKLSPLQWKLNTDWFPSTLTPSVQFIQTSSRVRLHLGSSASYVIYSVVVQYSTVMKKRQRMYKHGWMGKARWLHLSLQIHLGKKLLRLFYIGELNTMRKAFAAWPPLKSQKVISLTFLLWRKMHLQNTRGGR